MKVAENGAYRRCDPKCQSEGQVIQAGRRAGVVFLVQPTGGKLWRLKYRVDGKEKKQGPTDSSRAGELRRAIDGFEGQGITKQALQIAPHVFVRLGELRHAEWREIDLDGALWIIPAGKMRMRKAHHVPLSRQAVELLRQVQAVTGLGGYVFPSIRTRARPMSETHVVPAPKVIPKTLASSSRAAFLSTLQTWR